MTMISRIFLALSGLIVGLIGGSLLFDPVGFEAGTGLTLPQNPQLLSELRAPGAALLASGFFMALGALWTRFTRPALLLTAALYSSYGVGRLVGFALDGVSDTLIVVAAIELIVGVVALGLVFTTRAPRSESGMKVLRIDTSPRRTSRRDAAA